MKGRKRDNRNAKECWDFDLYICMLTGVWRCGIIYIAQWFIRLYCIVLPNKERGRLRAIKVRLAWRNPVVRLSVSEWSHRFWSGRRWECVKGEREVKRHSLTKVYSDPVIENSSSLNLSRKTLRLYPKTWSCSGFKLIWSHSLILKPHSGQLSTFLFSYKVHADNGRIWECASCFTSHEDVGEWVQYLVCLGMMFSTAHSSSSSVLRALCFVNWLQQTFDATSRGFKWQRRAVLL